MNIEDLPGDDENSNNLTNTNFVTTRAGPGHMGI